MNVENQQPVDDTEIVSMSFMVAAFLMILTGVVAVIAPQAAAITVELVLGVLLLFGGVGELLFAWQVKSFPGAFWRFLRGACFVIGGNSLLLSPVQGVMALAMVVGVLFLVDGFLRLMVIPSLKQNQILVGIDGILGIALGAIILAGLPGDAAWIIGVLVGIRFIMTGIVLLMIGSAFHQLPPLSSS